MNEITPRKMKLVVEKKENLVGDYWMVTLRGKEKFQFIPGQYLSVVVNGEGMRRSYSIASVPNQETIDLLVDVEPMGIGSKYFLGLQTGDEVEVLGPLGRFVVNKPTESGQMPMLFVATGSGIAPEKAMIETLLSNGYKGRLLLVWGMRYMNDLFWVDVFESWEKKYSNFGYRLVLSKPEEEWGGERGHVGDVLKQLEMAQWAGAYLCGNQDMVEGIKDQLIGEGMAGEKIYWERFD